MRPGGGDDSLTFFFRLFFLAFGGTFFPARRASDKPMAMACFRLFTFLPELFSVPSLRSCIAFSTFFEAALEYFRAMIRTRGCRNPRLNRQNIIPFQKGTGLMAGCCHSVFSGLESPP